MLEYAKCVIDGRGMGECKKLSIAFPTFIRASIKDKLVHRFDKNGVSYSGNSVWSKSRALSCVSTGVWEK